MFAITINIDLDEVKKDKKTKNAESKDNAKAKDSGKTPQVEAKKEKP